jgi:hypothetical protein
MDRADLAHQPDCRVKPGNDTVRVVNFVNFVSFVPLW